MFCLLLQNELEKEREHNREKDKQLLETFTKLADSQVALTTGQTAVKQKALAETLIEGQQQRITDGEQQKEKTEKQLAGIRGKLSNESFLSKAPEAVVNAERAKLEKLEGLLAQLTESEQRMKNL